MRADYASAVAAVRAAEVQLLDSADMERIISAKSVKEAAAALYAKGLKLPERESEISAALEGGLVSAWEFLRDYVPESRELEILLYRNDFHNLKAALKSLIANTDPERCFVRPALIDPEGMARAVSMGDYDFLPAYMRDPAEQAYRALTENSDGQLAEVILDSAALLAMQRAAEECGSEFMRGYAEEMSVCADIKTAYRGAAAGKREEFLEAAVAGSASLAKEPLISAALRGKDSVITYLESTVYAELGEALKESAAAFEKLCDERVTALGLEAKRVCFGTDPLAAYYLAKEAEVRNLRIIFVCKGLGVSEEAIRERVRRLYV